jgi:high affinity Mn2+ porin
MKRYVLSAIIVMAVFALFAEETPWYQKVEFAFGATGVVQRTLGTVDTLGNDKDFAEGSVSYDLETTLPVNEHGSLYAHLQAGQGAGVPVITFGEVNGDADDDATLRLTELWYEHGFGMFALKVGKLSLSADFDGNNVANSETEQFFNTAFINNPVLEFPADNGLGLVFRFSPIELLSVSLTASEADADWSNAFSNGFFMGELDFNPKFGELQGCYRLYGWSNGTDRENLTTGEIESANTGFGLSLDQQIPANLTLFARFGTQDDEVSEIGSAFSIGLQSTCAFWNRADDVVGLAFGSMTANDDTDLDNESQIEFYYSFRVNEHLAVSPDFQYIANPAGDGEADAVTVLGLRTQIAF